jgi:hypothetical protein
MDNEMKRWLLEIITAGIWEGELAKSGDKVLEAIVNNDWDELELEGWAREFFEDRYGEDYRDDGRSYYEQEMTKIDVLRPLVKEWDNDWWGLPRLPKTPNGSLHGIGFIYDEDKDDRVLVAIDQLKNNPDIVALAEHEGSVDIYTRIPTGLTNLDVCSDVWCVTEYVPYQAQWVEVDEQFIKNCVAQVLGRRKWKNDPPTDRQLDYLRALGYTGPDPTTKSEAGGLIAKYKK